VKQLIKLLLEVYLKKISLSNTVQGETALDTLNSTQFSISVNSLFTNDGPEVEALRF
jgi:hypothetical protein